MAGGDAVLTEVRGEVLVITLNRPDARNSVNGELAAGVAAAIERLDGDEALRVGVLTGAGKGFSAGMDLKAFVRGESPAAGGRGFGGICEGRPEKPAIAAIEGFAVAGGLEIALSCDLLVAGRSARLGIPEAKRGLVAGAGAPFRLASRVPRGLAMEMALTGDPIDAGRAHEVGLVDVLAEDGGALDAALELAGRISPNGPLAVRVSKRMVRELADLPDEEAWRAQSPLVEEIMNSADAREGAVAFAEKRDPVWSGR